MGKQRLTSADVAAEVACLRERIVGMRVSNVYDLSPKVYVLKLARSGEDGDRAFLLIESGVRFHTIAGMPPTPPAPSNFTIKLRRHIRSRRVEAVRQLGVDRVAALSFGSGDAACHLLLEFYAQGNVVLTDSSYTVLTLLRSHRDDAGGLATMARHAYPVHAIRPRVALPAEELRRALEGGAGGAGGKGGERGRGEEEGQDIGNEGEEKMDPLAASSQCTLSSALNAALGYGPDTAEHCALGANLCPARDLTLDPLSPSEFEAVLRTVRAWERWVDGTDAAAPEGFVLLEGGGGAEGGAGPTDAIPPAAKVASFQPLLLSQHAARPAVRFALFDDALRAYFVHRSRAQLSKSGEIAAEGGDGAAALASAPASSARASRVEAVERDQRARVEALDWEAAACTRRAAAIEASLGAVEAVLAAVSEALGTGTDWVELEKLIRAEAAQGNPIAGMVRSLDVPKKKVVAVLPDPDYEAGGGEDVPEGAEGAEKAEGAEIPAPPQAGRLSKKERRLLKTRDGSGPLHTRPGTLLVELELGLSAHANARAQYAARRGLLAKRERTLAALGEAVRSAEQGARQGDKASGKLAALAGVTKTGAQAAAIAAVSAAQAARKPHWFERFHWWISSENYLVLSGRDAQQNEMLVKRYMRTGDVYLHAELHGASSTIVINHGGPAVPVPPATLLQAGAACVCRSAAWAAKVVTSAWWVHAHQVSRTAPSGEYLPTGSFMIRGRKNYLPPQPLVLGLGFLFRLDDESLAGHVGERRAKGSGGDRGEDDDGEAGPVPAAQLSGAPSKLEAFLDEGVDALEQAFQRYGLSSEAHAQPAAHVAERVARDAAREPAREPSRGGSSAGRQQQHVRPAPAPAQASRPGGRGQARKAKKKDRYEDEEDRELARHALQAGGQKKDRGQRKKEHKARLAAKRSAGAPPSAAPVTAEDVARVTGRRFEEEGGDEEGSDDEEEEAVQERASHSAQRAPKESASTAAAEPSEAAAEPVEASDFDLDLLTALPRAGDVLHYALPVVAPYAALAGYKYAVKLVPGAQKKGAALKAAREICAAQPAAQPREVALVRAVPDPDAVNALVGAVKVATPMPGKKLPKRR